MGAIEQYSILSSTTLMLILAYIRWPVPGAIPHMNSYPPELLAQLAPVMFVAGLDTQAAPNSSPVPPRSEEHTSELQSRP